MFPTIITATSQMRTASFSTRNPGTADGAARNTSHRINEHSEQSSWNKCFIARGYEVQDNMATTYSTMFGLQASGITRTSPGITFSVSPSFGVAELGLEV